MGAPLFAFLKLEQNAVCLGDTTKLSGMPETSLLDWQNTVSEQTETAAQHAHSAEWHFGFAGHHRSRMMTSNPLANAV
jgi:hypothetical protein